MQLAAAGGAAGLPPWPPAPALQGAPISLHICIIVAYAAIGPHLQLHHRPHAPHLRHAAAAFRCRPFAPCPLQVRANSLQELVYKQGQAGITKATVSIVFDNRDKDRGPVGYEALDEITVTRQLVIGGRSKYLINGKVAEPT